MNDALDPRRVKRGKRGRNGLALVRRRAQDFVRIDRARRVDGDQVGEGPADIDTDAETLQRRISFSSSADL